MAKRRRARVIDERTSGRDDHRTPLWFIERIVRFRTIGLDPAGSKLRHTPASVARRVYRLDKGDDGLRDTWRGFGLTFCNPPYGRQVAQWARKAVAEFEPVLSIGRSSDELVLLVAARVDTRWFKLLWRYSSAVLLCNKRFQFIGETDPAKFPQAVLYFGRRVDRFVKHFGDLGLIIESHAVGPVDDAMTKRAATLHFAKERAA